MAAVFAKDSAHGEDAASRLAVSNDVPRESNGPQEPFILENARRFQEMHRSAMFLNNREAGPGEQLAPFADGQRSDADMNVARKFTGNCLANTRIDVVGNQA